MSHRDAGVVASIEPCAIWTEKDAKEVESSQYIAYVTVAKHPGLIILCRES